MKTMRGAITAVLIAVGMGFGAVRAAGQSRSRDSVPRIGCFRGQQLDVCRSFWILEMQGSVALAQTDRRIDYGDGTTYPIDAIGDVLEWNLGHMVNVNERWALGGVFTVGTGNSDLLKGIKVRARRWLHPDLSVELEGGLWRTDVGGLRWPGGNGVTADLRLNIRDQGSVFVRWDGVSLSERTFPGWDPGGAAYRIPGGFHQGVSVGASAGSVPGLVGSGALGLVYVVLLGLYLGGYD
jgi:hypothetical protein